MEYQELSKTIRSLGIAKNSQSWQDYEKAKSAILSPRMSAQEYASTAAAIARYLGLEEKP